MLTEPFELDSKKNWTQLSEIVKETYRKVNESINKTPFSFKITNLFNSNQEQIGLRCYCLGPVNNSTEFTLAYCDILNNENIQFNQNQGILINHPSNQQQQQQNSTNNDLNIEDNLDNLNLPAFQWKELLMQTDSKDDESNQKLSKEELIQLERKRVLVTGIVSYEFHEQQKRFLFSIDGSLHYVDDNGQAPYIPIKLPSKVKGAKINPSICPSNPNLIAYICENDLFVFNIETGIELRLTNCKLDYPNKVITCGLPSFIIQEEFSRFVGYWWQPSNTLTPNQYSILFEQVDETDVEELKISTFDGSTEEYRYPKPGKKNATSILKLAKFKLNESNEIHDLNIGYLNGINDFKQIYSEYEYFTNCNWYSEDSIIIHLLNRKQKNLVLFLISTDNKFPNQVLYEEINTDYWVNVTQVLEFLEDQVQIDLNKELSFIWASQETGFRHLYKCTVKLIEESNVEFDSTNPLKSKLVQKKQLTSGRWEVNDQNVWLDSKNSLVYFIGLKDSPLERQLYVLSLNNEFETIKRLTTSGYSNGLILFNSQCSSFINILSNISKPPFGFLNLIQNSNTDLPSIHRVGYIIRNKLIKSDGSVVDCIEQFEQMPGFSRPELFSYQLKDSGDIVYGLIYKPHYMQADKKYPVLLEVYGGPSTSLISNTFRSVRLFSRHILASQGYVVCVFDCRGSSNRGLAFEGHLYKRLGQVEVNDQVEVLQWLASNTNYIDLNRIAVHGFSYGGYLSLLFYAKRPDIFRLCLAGAPVTNWELYDTGYTERYMDTPENNKNGYAQGSVLNHVCNFPNEENRLLLVHGLNDENVFFNNTVELINELVKAGKPYDLLVYPNERHCLGRDPQSRMHLETAILSFLNKNL